MAASFPDPSEPKTFNEVPRRVAALALLVLLGCRRDDPTPAPSDGAEDPRGGASREAAAVEGAAVEGAGSGGAKAPVASGSAIVGDSGQAEREDEGVVAPADPSQWPPLATLPKRRLALAESQTCVLDRDGHPTCVGSPPDADPWVGSEHRRLEVVAGSVAVGASHACALQDTGELQCWGSNERGQIGEGGGVVRTPRRLGTDATYRAVAAARDGTCAITTEGALRCWGELASAGAHSGVAGVLDAVAVAAGPTGELCVLDRLGRVHCKSGPPGPVEGLPQSVEIGVGRGFVCALGADRVVRCWGSNESGGTGQVPAGGTIASPTPVLNLPSDVVRLAVGPVAACALLASDDVWCWGTMPTEKDWVAARRIVGLPKITELAVAERHACALATDAVPWCWGNLPVRNPTRVEGIPATKRFASSETSMCWVATDGTVQCKDWWGKEAIETVEGIENPDALVAIDEGGCALTAGKAQCWGNAALTKDHDEHDDCDWTAHAIGPADLRSIDGFVQQVCATTEDGQVWCWGSAESKARPQEGQVAFGPRPVRELDGAVELAVHAFGSDCARRADASLWCWPGARPERDPAPIAKAVPGFPPVVAIDGAKTVCAITDANGVWCVDPEGEVEEQKVSLPSRPVDIANHWTELCVLLDDGRVSCWDPEAIGVEESKVEMGVVAGIDRVVSMHQTTYGFAVVREDGSVLQWSTPGTTTETPVPLTLTGGRSEVVPARAEEVAPAPGGLPGVMDPVGEDAADEP